MTLFDDIQHALEDVYGSDQRDEASALIDKLEDRGLRVTRELVRDSGDERVTRVSGRAPVLPWGNQ